MNRPRSLSRLVLAAAAVVLLTGCLSQPDSANDNGPQPDAVQPSDVTRSG